MSRNQPFSVSRSLSLSCPPSSLQSLHNTAVYNISSSLSPSQGRQRKLNKILFLPDLNLFLLLSPLSRPLACLPFPLLISVNSDPFIYCIAVRFMFLTIWWGRGFVCDVNWCNVHISNSGILSDGMFWKGQVHTTTTHRLLGPSVKRWTVKGRERERWNNVFVCWYK